MAYGSVLRFKHGSGSRDLDGGGDIAWLKREVRDYVLPDIDRYVVLGKGREPLEGDGDLITPNSDRSKFVPSVGSRCCRERGVGSFVHERDRGAVDSRS